MDKKLRYISLFSGIEAASVAWEPLGWEAVAFAEIDPFPSAVLAYRFPNVPNLGDVTKVDWGGYRGTVDVVVGGSPCQSFSVSGRRESLGGESRLMYEYIRACSEIRSRWILWENVPGVLNTKDNAFGQLISELQDIGYVSLAWRVLDSQFFGVAQRRRRVFLVGHLGNDGSAPAVLFESESVRGNTQTGGEKRQAIAVNAAGCTHGACERDVTVFKYSAGSAARTMPTYDDGSCNTLTADWHSPAICETRLQSSNGTDVVGALCARDYKGVGEQYVGEGKVICTTDTSHAPYNDGYVIRRLTPIECERLQGFPDDWTKVPWKGRSADDCPDGPRYKAIGNSMTTNVMRWIGKRIELVEGLTNGDQRGRD